jgi:hypothetical protein
MCLFALHFVPERHNGSFATLARTQCLKLVFERAASAISDLRKLA